jgi:hypothetical protein
MGGRDKVIPVRAILISGFSGAESGDEARLGGFRRLNRPSFSFAGMTASDGGGIALSFHRGEGAVNGLNRGDIRSN